MKKILFTLACITIAASSLLMASGQKEATVDTSKSDELVVWLWDMGFNGATMQKAAEIYKEDHPEFNLVIEDQGDWNTLQTKLTTIASSGKLDSLPDILLIQDNAFQKNYMSFPEVFTDLSNTNIDYTQFASGKTGYSVIDGENYGVPFDNGAVIFGYRTDILAKAGYTIDDFTDITWSQWLKQAKVVLEKTGKPLLSAQAGSSDIINMMLQSAGASLFNTDGSPNIVNNDVLYKVAETYMQMLDDGTCIEATDWSGYTNSFSSGAVAGTMTGCWIAATIQGATDQAGKWKITNMPSLDGIPTATNYSNNGGSSWAVTSACKNIDLAADFFAMTFGSSMELYDAVAQNGVLGTYLPSANSSVYSQPNEFFSSQPIMSIITEFAGKVPAIEGGAYYYDARDAVCTAITQIQSGAVAKEAFQDAQDTVNFMMGN
ncbi:MAG: ABC transporter substrate-binding protein [Sphaerochaeta sp.]